MSVRGNWSASRREFLAASAAAALTASAAASSRGEEKSPTALRGKAEHCIFIWLGGGSGQIDTWDPKQQGDPKAKKPGSYYPAIDTAIPGVQICKGLEHIAGVLDRGTLIRSHVVADLGNILHSRHQYHWHTGYVPPQTVACPHIGSWIARVRGPNNPVLPPFINIGQRLEGNGEQEELKAFTAGGFFGTEFGPFNLPFPTDAADAVETDSSAASTTRGIAVKRIRRSRNASTATSSAAFNMHPAVPPILRA